MQPRDGDGDGDGPHPHPHPTAASLFMETFGRPPAVVRSDDCMRLYGRPVRLIMPSRGGYSRLLPGKTPAYCLIDSSMY